MDIDYYIRNGHGQLVDSGNRRTDALWESVATKVCVWFPATRCSFPVICGCFSTHTHTHARARAHTHTRAHTYTHTHTHTAAATTTSTF
jgi:hypothetical protein